MSKALPRPEHDTTNFRMYNYNSIYVNVLKQMIAVVLAVIFRIYRQLEHEYLLCRLPEHRRWVDSASWLMCVVNPICCFTKMPQVRTMHDKTDFGYSN